MNRALLINLQELEERAELNPGLYTQEELEAERAIIIEKLRKSL